MIGLRVPERTVEADAGKYPSHFIRTRSPRVGRQTRRVPRHGELPQLIQRHERALRHTVRCAPCIDLFFATEEQHRLSRVDNVPPPVRSGHRGVKEPTRRGRTHLRASSFGEVSPQRWRRRTVRGEMELERLVRLLATGQHNGRGVQSSGNPERVPRAVGEVRPAEGVNLVLGLDARKRRSHADGLAVGHEHQHSIRVETTIRVAHLIAMAAGCDGQVVNRRSFREICKVPIDCRA